MSDLSKLYAERDRLRSVRHHLESKLEQLVVPMAENTRAINEHLRAMPRPSMGDPAKYPLQHTTREDLPEFFEAVVE